jgi:hypothetical protein
MGTGGSFPGGEEAGREAYHKPASSAEVKNVWSLTYTPNAPSWCGAQLKDRDTFTFYLYMYMTISLPIHRSIINVLKLKSTALVLSKTAMLITRMYQIVEYILKIFTSVPCLLFS